MDEAAGFRYYKLAADQGSLEGLFGVAVCYENGEGVAVDLDEAWRLMNSALAMAQANGDPAITSDIHAGLARIKSARRWKRRDGHDRTRWNSPDVLGAPGLKQDQLKQLRRRRRRTPPRQKAPRPRRVAPPEPYRQMPRGPFVREKCGNMPQNVVR